MSKDNKKFEPKGEDVIRQEVIKDYGLDPNEEVNKPFINRLTSERMDNQNKLSKAIEQKRNYRNAKDYYKTAAEKAGLDPKSGKPLEKKEDKPDQPKVDENKFVTKEEFARNQLRQSYSHLTDDEFEFVEAQAKGSGKKFKDVLETPIVKNYLETNEVNSRIAGATGSPSSRYRTSGSSEEDKISKELDSDLPVGFSSKRN